MSSVSPPVFDPGDENKFSYTEVHTGYKRVVSGVPPCVLLPLQAVLSAGGGAVGGLHVRAGPLSRAAGCGIHTQWRARQGQGK